MEAIFLAPERFENVLGESRRGIVSEPALKQPRSVRPNSAGLSCPVRTVEGVGPEGFRAASALFEYIKAGAGVGLVPDVAEVGVRGLVPDLGLVSRDGGGCDDGVRLGLARSCGEGELPPRVIAGGRV